MRTPSGSFAWKRSKPIRSPLRSRLQNAARNRLSRWPSASDSGQGENFVMGVFVDGQLVGMTGFFRRVEEKTRHRGVISGVYVKPDFRRQGIAHALMSAVISRAPSHAGLEQITLAVSSERPPAKALYASLGFTSCQLEPRALRVGDKYVDEEWMMLKI